MQDKNLDTTVASAGTAVQHQGKPGKSNRALILTIVIAAVLVVGAGLGGYFYGVSVGQSQFPGNDRIIRGQFNNGPVTQKDGATGDQPRNGFAGGPGGGVFGSITKIDGTTLTVKTQNAEIMVKTTDTTLIEKYASVKVADLAIGEQIVVSGSTNEDGSVTARSIQTMRGAAVITDTQP